MTVVAGTPGTSSQVTASGVLLDQITSPVLTGKLRVGPVLHCSMGLWDIPPKISNYQWFRGATQIADASSQTYHVKKIDAGRRIRCGVVITYRDGRSTSKASVARAIARGAAKAK